MRIYTLIFASMISIGARAEAEEEGAAKDRVGLGKAVIAATKEQGIKLSEKALKTLELGFMPLHSSQVTVPHGALVHFQDFSAIYRLRDGWFRLVEVEPVINGNHVSFSSKEFKPGDQVVIQNGSLIRVVELDVFGPEADACVD